MSLPNIWKSFRLIKTHRTSRIWYSSMAHKTSRLVLLLDFDGTITNNDTTAIIGSKCLAKSQALARPGLSEDKRPRSMDFYGEKYMQEYQAWKDSQTRRPEDCRTIEEVVLHLSASRSVEERSFFRVRDAVLSNSNALDGIVNDETRLNDFMVQCGRQAVQSGKVEIRDAHSLRQLIHHAEQNSHSWAIISVNWSRRFILGVLMEANLVNEERAEDVVKRVKCNELLAPIQYDQDGRALIICTAEDKLNALKEATSSLRCGEEGQTFVIYVGDSSTDVGCLAEATVGFHLNNSGKENAAVQAVEKCGIQGLTFDALMEGPVRESHTITEVEGFDEIWAWVSKTFPSSS